MLLLGLYFLGSFGFAFIVGHSKISYPIRLILGGDAPANDGDLEVPPLVPYVGPFLVALAECAGCLGFWIGLSSATSIWVLAALPEASLLVKLLVFSQATAGSNFILSRICRLS